MQNRILLFFGFWILGLSIYAQSEMEAPDYKVLKQHISNTKSPNYYPRLLKRFMENDTTLMVEDYRTLYYGFTMQEDYNPYRESNGSEVLQNIHFPIDNDKTVSDTIIVYGLKALADFPFDLRAMNLLIYAYQSKGLKEEAHLWSIKLMGILDAIISSGDGQSPETAYHVITLAHEYDIINRFGLTAKSQSLIEPHFDYIQVEDNKFKISGYYFNISKILSVYHQKFEEAHD